METAQWYRWFAEHEARGSSPQYERLALAVADDGELLTSLACLAPAKRQPNLLFASVRMLGGSTESVDAFVDFLRTHWERVAAMMTARSTQTNEAARCAAFVPVLAEAERDVALIEVGAAAGLCLVPDRYAYRYDTHHIGNSRLEIHVDAGGTLHPPRRLPEVVWRAGLDLNPLDVNDADDVAWLRACIWPEHEERRRRLDLAVSIVADDPPRIERGDLRDATVALVDEAPRGAIKFVVHSAVLAYVDERSRRAFATTMRRLTRERDDVVWLSNEGPAVIAGIDPEGAQPRPPAVGARLHLTRNGTDLLAITDPHGRWLRWMSPPSRGAEPSNE